MVICTLIVIIAGWMGLKHEGLFKTPNYRKKLVEF